MKAPVAPPLDKRRAADFAAELRERALAWIPSWGLADSEQDFGRALLEIAARFHSEVAERLDGSGDKMRRGLLDWLGVRGKAARPARLPVVFKLIDSAREAVLAQAPVRMQADAAGVPVIFETEKDVRVVPGRVEIVVGTDVTNDAFYLPPPGLSDLQPLEPLPAQWRLKSFAAAGATKLQLDPESGLAADLILEAGGRQYKIVKADNDLVTIEPPLEADLDKGKIVSKVTALSPFDGTARNWQEHALYLGDSEFLNVESAATFEVVGASTLREGITWEYWGKVDPEVEVGWQQLRVDAKSNALVLAKDKGAMEPLDINGRSAHWIRAFAKTVRPGDDPFSAESISIRLNSSGCTTGAKCPPDTGTASPAAEGMANTTPLVLENVFFPLGKEPRQFDAFYLGSQEAFSKAGAKVQLCFEMADRTFSTLSAVREGTFANQVLAGVAKDRALHLLGFNSATGGVGKFRERNPLQPPLPGYQGQSEPGNTVALDQQPGWRLPVWSEPEPDSAPLAGFLVATSAADAVWIWHEHPNKQTSGWINFGKLPAVGPATAAAVDGLVYLAGTPAKIAALRDGRLFLRDWPNGAQWDPVDTKNGAVPITLKSIVPVHDGTSGALVTSDAAGIVGIDNNRKLFHVATRDVGAIVRGACTPVRPGADFVIEVRPAAITVGGNLTVFAVRDDSPWELVAEGAFTDDVDLGVDAKAVAALEVERIDSKFHVLATVRDAAGGHLVTWGPLETGSAAPLFTSPVSVGAVEGAPTAVAGYVVVPGARADILTNKFDPADRIVDSATVAIGIVVPSSVPAPAVGDVIVRMDGVIPEPRTITQPGLTLGGEVFYPIDAEFPLGASGLDWYDRSAFLVGDQTASNKLKLHPADNDTKFGTWLRIAGVLYNVTNLTPTTPPVATLFPDPALAAGTVEYVRPIALAGRVAPYMSLDPNAGGNGDWDADLLDQIQLIFPNDPPGEQKGKAFSTFEGHPVVVVLGAEFAPPATGLLDFVLDAAYGEWRRDLGDTSANPELSWEYWNGKGWWNLGVTFDETQHLKATGAVRFTVPADLESSDWAGKTNHWIRARLIGGDYGREKVTVKITDLGGGESEQTVERTSEGIRAPSVLQLHISYGVCDAVQPAFVLTQDSGSIRDQSDANRTAGAIVEAFVPLAVTLGRLSKAAAKPSASGGECPPECDCHGRQSAAAVGTAAVADPAAAPPIANGRALFIGVAGSLSGAPVNVLLVVDERLHTLFAPMAIDTLVADRFIPIVANDATRALGESGLLSMAFAVPPTPAELFGKTLSWLRLTPKEGANVADWSPTVRGVYLNAAWASATETLTRELVGSSDGAPNLTLSLARPPVLQDTLELRVKEPLGEEEREELRSQGEDRVLSAVEGLPGDWVLWNQVSDPGDEPAAARVYALDEAKGEIRFGDGLHGAIPPIGRDSIVAFSYKRTEPPPPGTDNVPGNAIGARAALNLVSPVESVEAVFSAGQGAGGAPSESDERVLRYGFARLRHRDRAVTAHDIEDLALQSSPDIVQARAIVRRDSVRLVVVMRGSNPRPSAAQVRELRRLLLSAAPASLSAATALRIEGPRIRKLRFDLRLQVLTLDHAGAVADLVKERLAGFFDTGTGGADKDGWALGVNPKEEDIAFALVDTPHLESIENVTLRESADDGSERPWPETLRATEIAMLADDPVRIQFETAEVLA